MPLTDCEVDLRLAGREGEMSIALARYCFDGRDARPGGCGWATVEGEVELVADGFSVELEDEIELSYGIRIPQRLQRESTVRTRVSCLVDGVRMLEADDTSLDPGAFDVEPGDVLRREVSVFGDDDYGTPSRRQHCEIEALFRSAELFDDTEFHPIGETCLRNGELSQGRCEGFPSPPATDPGDAPVSVASIHLEPENVYGGEGKQLALRVDVVTQRPGDVRLHGRLACQGPGGRRESTALLLKLGMEAARVGESSRMQTTVFGSPPLADTPKRCEVTVTDWQDKTLGTWCWKPGSTRPGACSGKR